MTQPTKFHQALAVIAFAVLVAVFVMDGFIWYEASRRIAIIFAVIFLILAGFGSIVETALENR